MARVHDKVLGNYGHQVLFHKNMCASCPSTRRKVARAFRTTILQKWGTSVRKLITDRDRRLNSRLWEWWEQRQGVTGRRTTSYRPQADGSSERAFRSILQHLRIALCELVEIGGNTDREWTGATWVDTIPVAEYTYNASRHSGTTFTQLFLEHGREPTRALDILGQEDKTYNELEDAGYREGAEK